MIQPVKPNRTYSRSARRGFSFTEILFAVMILGIGFIMVAAVFPVAIKQTQETVDDTTAADVAKGAAAIFARNATSLNFPVSYGVNAGTGKPNTYMVGASTYNNYCGAVVQYAIPPNVSIGGLFPFWNALSGNLILSTDQRYAWVPFYSRSADANGNALNYAQVTIIAVLCRNSSIYTTADLNNGLAANLVGRAINATFTTNGAAGNVDTIAFSGPSLPSVAEGCYVIISDDSKRSNWTPATSANGNVYRVGQIRRDLDASGATWELMPGGDTKTANVLHPAPTGVSIPVFIVGRGLVPGSTTVVGGEAMDIAAYSTFIQVHASPGAGL